MSIRINPDEKDFNIFKEINKIHTHIKKSSQKSTEKSTTKSLIDDLPKSLMELDLKSHFSIKSRCLKWVVKKYYQQYNA